MELRERAKDEWTKGKRLKREKGRREHTVVGIEKEVKKEEKTN